MPPPPKNSFAYRVYIRKQLKRKRDETIRKQLKKLEPQIRQIISLKTKALRQEKLDKSAQLQEAIRRKNGYVHENLWQL